VSVVGDATWDVVSGVEGVWVASLRIKVTEGVTALSGVGVGKAGDPMSQAASKRQGNVIPTMKKNLSQMPALICNKISIRPNFRCACAS